MSSDTSWGGHADIRCCIKTWCAPRSCSWRASSQDHRPLRPPTGIEPFGRLVTQVMSTEPYASARVFWVADNGNSHRGKAAAARLNKDWPDAHLVNLPIHASWLNQVEIYFSVVQRKVLTPSDFADLAEVEQRLLDFERRYETAAQPFEWKFTRSDLAKLLERIAEHEALPDAA